MKFCFWLVCLLLLTNTAIANLHCHQILEASITIFKEQQLDSGVSCVFEDSRRKDYAGFLIAHQSENGRRRIYYNYSMVKLLDARDGIELPEVNTGGDGITQVSGIMPQELGL